MSEENLVQSAHPRLDAIGNRLAATSGKTRALGLATIAGLTMGGYVGVNAMIDDGNTTGPAPELLDLDQAEQARELCDGDDLDMTTPIAEEFEQSRMGNDDTAVLPSFVAQDANGERVLTAPEDVAVTLVNASCVSPTLLAIFDSAWLETSGYNEQGNRFLPDATLISRIQDNAELFRVNNPAALNSLNKLASIVAPSEGATEYDGGIEYVDNFTVVGGSAVMITPVRGENGEAQNIALAEVLTDGIFDGYQLRFPEDPSLTEEERAILDEISSLILITPNGEIIINSWIGTGTTDFDVEGEPTEAEPTPATDPEVSVPAAEEEDEDGSSESEDEGEGVDEDAEGEEGTDEDEDGEAGTDEGDQDESGPDDGTDNDNGCDGDGNPDCEGGDDSGDSDDPEVTTPATTTPATTTPATTHPPATTTPATTTPATTTPPTTTPPTTTPPTTTPPTTTTTTTTTTTVPPKDEQPTGTTTTIPSGY